MTGQILHQHESDNQPGKENQNNATPNPSATQSSVVYGLFSQTRKRGREEEQTSANLELPTVFNRSKVVIPNRTNRTNRKVRSLDFLLSAGSEIPVPTLVVDTDDLVIADLKRQAKCIKISS